jgi:hypothetical protein
MSWFAEPFVGVWVEHLNGALILTLEDKYAGVLSSALVVFVGIAATQTWNIVRFGLHQVQAMSQVQDGYYQQMQVVLRNGTSYTATSWLALRLAWAWKERLGGMTAWRRGSPLLIISVLCFTGFYSAQLFTSMIWTTAGDRFLVQNGACGRLHADEGSMDSLLLLNRYWIGRIEEASIYERQCYSSPSNSGRCEKLPIPRLAWTMQDSACPFTDPNLCADDAVAVRMDTGYINSNSDLGVNARSEDSIVYRKVVTCSPLKTHFSVLANNDPADRVVRYWYGRNNLLDTDYTFEYSMNMSVNRAYKTT